MGSMQNAGPAQILLSLLSFHLVGAGEFTTNQPVCASVQLAGQCPQTGALLTFLCLPDYVRLKPVPQTGRFLFRDYISAPMP